MTAPLGDSSSHYFFCSRVVGHLLSQAQPGPTRLASFSWGPSELGGHRDKSPHPPGAPDSPSTPTPTTRAPTRCLCSPSLRASLWPSCGPHRQGPAPSVVPTLGVAGSSMWEGPEGSPPTPGSPPSHPFSPRLGKVPSAHLREASAETLFELQDTSIVSQSIDLLVVTSLPREEGAEGASVETYGGKVGRFVSWTHSGSLTTSSWPPLGSGPPSCCTVTSQVPWERSGVRRRGRSPSLVSWKRTSHTAAQGPSYPEPPSSGHMGAASAGSPRTPHPSCAKSTCSDRPLFTEGEGPSP